jgi:hypothetical protein
MKPRTLLLTLSVLALSACSATSGDPTGSGTVAANADTVLAALTAPLQGPVSVMVTNGTDRREIVETETGDRILRLSDGDERGEFRVLDRTIYSTIPSESSFAGRWYAIAIDDLDAGEEITPLSPLDDLFDDATSSVFGYSLQECIDNDSTPQARDESWVVTCAEGVDLTITLEDGRLSALDLGDGYAATVRYEAEDVTAPTDLLSEQELEVLTTEMIEITVTDAVLSTLEALRRNGEAIWAANTTLTDRQTADEASRDGVGGTVTELVREGESGIRVTGRGPGITCSGTVTFVRGAGTIVAPTCS